MTEYQIHKTYSVYNTVVLSLLIISVVITGFSSYSGDADTPGIETPPINIQLLNEIPMDEDKDFFFGEITDASAFPGGPLFVLDRIKKKIHIFSSDGRFLSSNLREGRGPGEISMPQSIIRTSDDGKVAFYDQGLQRISIFNFVDDMLQHFLDVRVSSPVRDFHFMPDGRILVYEPSAIGESPAMDQVFMVSLDGVYENKPVLTFESGNQLTLSPASGNMQIGISTPFHTRNLFCFREDKMIFNRSNQTGFIVYDLETGTALSGVKINRPDIPLPMEKREEVIDDIMKTGLLESSERRRLINEMPDTYPHVNAIECRTDGFVWLNLIIDDDRSKWVLFSERGESIGRLDLDPEETVMHFDQNHVYTKHEADYGNPVLRIYLYEAGHNDSN